MRQFDEVQNSIIRDLRYTLSHTPLDARQSNIRQASLRMQLRIASEHQRRVGGDTSG